MSRHDELSGVDIVALPDVQSLFAIAIDAVLIFDLDTEEILDANELACHMYGYARDELLGATLDLIQPPDRRGRLRTDELLRIRRSPRKVIEHRRQDGMTIEVEVDATLALCDGQQVVISTNRDVTSRLQTERLLGVQRRVLESIARATALQEVLELLCVEMERLLDDAVCGVLELRGRLLYPKAGPSIPANIASQFDGLEPGRGSCGAAVLEGKPVYVADALVDPRWEGMRDTAREASIRGCWSTPLFTDSGAILGTFAICRARPGEPNQYHKDVLQTAGYVAEIAFRREQDEASLRESEERFRLATMAAQDAIYDWDVIADTTWWSERSEALINPKHQNSWANGIHGDDRERVLSDLQQALDGDGQDWNAEYAFIRPDGRMVHVMEAGIIVRDADGRARRVIGALSDVTAVKEASAEIERQAHTERLLFRELDHRVRNNLASLITLIGMTQRSGQDVDQFAESIGGRVQAMASVHGMLSRAHWTPIGLRELVESLVPDEVADSIEASGPTVRIAARQATALGMLVHELVANALKHGALSRTAGRVDIRWTLGDGPEPGTRALAITWTEQGGPAPSETIKASVGTELIIGLARSELRGDARLTYRQTGARHELNLVLDDADMPEPLLAQVGSLRAGRTSD